jgi:hypothetical protein
MVCLGQLRFLLLLYKHGLLLVLTLLVVLKICVSFLGLLSTNQPSTNARGRGAWIANAPKAYKKAREHVNRSTLTSWIRKQTWIVSSKFVFSALFRPTNPGVVMWDFVMDDSGAGAGFLRELRFPLSIYIPSASPQSSSLSPEAGTIGHEWPQCQ